MRQLIAILPLTLSLTVQAEDRYHVKFEPGLGSVSVEACFDGAPPPSLYRHGESWRFTENVRGMDGLSSRGVRPGHLKLSGVSADSCVKWKVNLNEALAENNHRLALKLNGAVLSDADLWFWRDTERRPIRVELELPPGMSVSTPWKEQTGKEGMVFRPGRTPASWSSRIAVGELNMQNIAVRGAQLRLAVVGQVSDSQLSVFGQWMQEAAECVASVEGSFPQPLAQILVVAIGKQNEAVPWAHVMRGGGVAAEFFVDENRSLEEFRADWTATHELSHMLLPMVSSRDRWLSEGLASYYQNVLRGRDGRLEEVAAWRKLHAGFERGKHATNGDSLAEATRSGWGSIMRIYWSGAAMFLKADARLRILSGGAQSLDTVLSAFQACCLDASRSWRGRELFAAFDRISGYTVFTDVYDEHVPDGEFPDLAETYAQLGLVPGTQTIELDPEAPQSKVRVDIMRGSSP
jgi:predicted metalloprotease with PDZ domain